MMTFLILWLLLGVCTALLDLYLCKIDKEKVTVGALITGVTIHLLVSPYCACMLTYDLLKRSNIKIFKPIKDLWNKEIL